MLASNPRIMFARNISDMLHEVAREAVSRFSLVERFQIFDAITQGARGKALHPAMMNMTAGVWPRLSPRLKARILLFQHLADSTHSFSTQWIPNIGGPAGVRRGKL